MKVGYVYIMSNAHNTVLYTGVTSDLEKRVYEHKNNITKGFTSKYQCYKLVYWEQAGDMYQSIMREKQIKAGSRKKKELLINEKNPDWADLSESWQVEQ